MTDLGTLGQAQSEAHGINNLGHVVGSSFTGWWGDGHAFVYADGSMTDLNALIDPASGWTIADASDINNKGQIAAVAFKDGIQYAVRLDVASPVPEPATAGMLLAGAGLLGFRNRRKAVAA
jgi:probable HAF family extracellular repeat protein